MLWVILSVAVSLSGVILVFIVAFVISMWKVSAKQARMLDMTKRWDEAVSTRGVTFLLESLKQTEDLAICAISARRFLVASIPTIKLGVYSPLMSPPDFESPLEVLKYIREKKLLTVEFVAAYFKWSVYAGSPPRDWPNQAAITLATVRITQTLDKLSDAGLIDAPALSAILASFYLPYEDILPALAAALPLGALETIVSLVKYALQWERLDGISPVPQWGLLMKPEEVCKMVSASVRVYRLILRPDSPTREMELRILGAIDDLLALSLAKSLCLMISPAPEEV